MRTRVTRSFRFEAAHQLPWHPGPCQNLHGHSYRLEVTVGGPVDERGVVVDFDELATLVQAEVIDRFDHRFLNDVLDNPTAELIAADIWKRLEAVGLGITRIALWETPDSVAELFAE
ncbi:MAG TPA: 6-carboxytetrahydropterin synthase QueD [Acidimicrobiales bacterium]|nr:6-carboxytetrahydropterin synthase QueD [Acidimicrobiales bacterium]